MRSTTERKPVPMPSWWGEIAPENTSEAWAKLDPAEQRAIKTAGEKQMKEGGNLHYPQEWSESDLPGHSRYHWRILTREKQADELQKLGRRKSRAFESRDENEYNEHEGNADNTPAIIAAAAESSPEGQLIPVSGDEEYHHHVNTSRAYGRSLRDLNVSIMRVHQKVAKLNRELVNAGMVGILRRQLTLIEVNDYPDGRRFGASAQARMETNTVTRVRVTATSTQQALEHGQLVVHFAAGNQDDVGDGRQYDFKLSDEEEVAICIERETSTRKRSRLSSSSSKGKGGGGYDDEEDPSVDA